MNNIKFKNRWNYIFFYTVGFFVCNAIKAYLYVRAFIEALPMAFKNNILKKNVYKKFIAYGLVISIMKHGDTLNEDNDCWEGELPSIYDLDSITNVMNENINGLNDTLKMKKDVWTRNEVKTLMVSFERAYNDYCKVFKKQLTIAFVMKRIHLLLEESFFTCFKNWYSMKLHDIAEKHVA